MRAYISSESDIISVIRWISDAEKEGKQCVIAVIRDGCCFCNNFVKNIEEFKLERCVILVKINDDGFRQEFYRLARSLDHTSKPTVPSVWVCGKWQSAGSETTKEALLA